MLVIWTSEAKLDLKEILDYLERDNQSTADSLECFLLESADRLSDFPEMGKVGEIVGTRELIPHGSYRIVYEVLLDSVQILAVVHTARLWPQTV